MSTGQVPVGLYLDLPLALLPCAVTQRPSYAGVCRNAGLVTAVLTHPPRSSALS